MGQDWEEKKRKDLGKGVIWRWFNHPQTGHGGGSTTPPFFSIFYFYFKQKFNYPLKISIVQ
jgi:hypothetical protein